MYHYAVNNSAPRPESYLTGKFSTILKGLIFILCRFVDYTTVNGPNVNSTLNEIQKAAIYAELASGAETGWDYSLRWFQAGKRSSGLLALNVRNTVAVDLNSILCTSSYLYGTNVIDMGRLDKNHLLLADLYGTSHAAASDKLKCAAAALKAGILDLMWDPQKVRQITIMIASWLMFHLACVL